MEEVMRTTMVKSALVPSLSPSSPSLFLSYELSDTVPLYLSSWSFCAFNIVIYIFKQVTQSQHSLFELIFSYDLLL